MMAGAHDSAGLAVDPSTELLDEPSRVDSEAAIMARNGITRVPADQYHVDGYRYTNLGDAMAQVALSAPARRPAR